jgi:plastocyanin
MRTSRIPIFVSVIALMIAACGGSSSSAPGASSAAASPASSAAASSNAVEMKNIAFNPTSVTVKAGDKVTWTNNDTVAHTVTLDDNSVDSGEVAAGATFANTFATAGTFAYHCKIHSVMHATVTVTP